MAHRGLAQNLASLAARRSGLGGRAPGGSGAAYSTYASHGGLPPKLAEHCMTPLLKKQGAYFIPGVEDYHWVPYYGGASAPKWELPKDNPTPGWYDHVMAETENALHNCAIDLPIFGLVNVQGPNAGELINRGCTKKYSKIAGNVRLAYTLKKDGTLWNDVSLSTRGENDIYFIGLMGFGKYEMDELTALKNEFGYTDDDVTLTGASYDKVLFHVFGPKAPKILAEILGPEILDVPYFKFRPLTVKGGIPLEAFSMSYCALPGWELHVDREYAPQLYDMLLSHPLSKAEGFKPCGLTGIQSFRTEMWFRGTPDVKDVVHYKGGMINGGIGKNHEGYGMDAPPTPKQLVMLNVDVPKGYEWSMYGGQYPVFQNGQQVGVTRHSALGARSKRTHAFALLDAAAAGAGKMSVIHAHNKEMPCVELAAPLVQSSFKDRAHQPA